jgi:Uncharacterized protein conserved in bacteria
MLDSLLKIEPEDIGIKRLEDLYKACMKGSGQVVFVSVANPEDSVATLFLFEKTNGMWQKVSPEMKAFIGKNGLKLVMNAPLSEALKELYKCEGDGCSPMGVFTITSLFGWDKNPGFNLPYRRITKYDYWVSGNSLEEYNVLINKKDGPSDSWPIFEVLKIPVYKYAAVIDYNIGPERIPGNGSAIFLHISDDLGYTYGCTSVSESNLLKILKWLKPEMKPVFALFPAVEIKNKK